MSTQKRADVVSDAERVLDPDNEFSAEELEALGFTDSATVKDGEQEEQDQTGEEVLEDGREGEPSVPQVDPVSTDPETKPTYSTALDYVLRHEGFQGDEVEVDGQKKKISDLTAEEQMDLLVEAYERKSVALAEKSKAAAPTGEAAEILEFLSKGGTPTQLAQMLLERDPAAQASRFTNEQLVTENLKKLYPEYSEQDIEDELKFLKTSGRLDRQAEILRERMIKSQPEIKGLTAEMEQQRNQSLERERAQALQEYEQEAEQIRTYVQKVSKVGEIEVPEDVRQYIGKQILSESAEKDSPFLEKLSTPDKLFRLAFLDEYHDEIVRDVAARYYEMGLSKAKETTSKFSDEPKIQVGGYRSTRTKNETKPSSKKDAGLDYDKLLTVDEI